MTAAEVKPGAPAGDPLAHLDAQAAELEGGIPGSPQAVEAQAAAGLEAATVEAREVVELVASLVLPFLPESIAARYGQRQLDAIGSALGKVAAKRGWSVGGFLGRYGDEIALAAAVVGPALPVLLAEAKKRKEAAEAARQRPPESGQVEPVAPAADPVPVDHVPPANATEGQRL